MGDPVLHLLAGPNGAGKSTLFERIIGPRTHLMFINADRLADKRWGKDAEMHAYEASAHAAELRRTLIANHASFATEIVFSHTSKLELITEAQREGYLVTLHVVIVPEDLSVMRVAERVRKGGHSVPEDKIRARHRRLWPLVARALELADEGYVYDNSRARRPFACIARFRSGRLVITPSWPDWAPDPLHAVGRLS